MKDFYLYILQCNDGSYYVGNTDDIYVRLEQHATNNIISYVSKRLPAKLVYIECFPSRDDAKNAEKKIKGWSREKKKALIAGGLPAVTEFIRNRKTA